MNQRKEKYGIWFGSFLWFAATYEKKYTLNTERAGTYQLATISNSNLNHRDIFYLMLTYFLCHAKVKIWFQNRRMKWRNSKERELLSTGGCRQQTLPTKTNPHPDLTDVGSTYSHRLSRIAPYNHESHLCCHHHNPSTLSESGKQSELSQSDSEEITVL